MMHPDQNDGDSSGSEGLATINVILDRAVDIHRLCLGKKAEWSRVLGSMEAEVRRAAQEEVMKAASCLKIWGEMFDKEISEAFVKQQMLVNQNLDEIHSLQSSLNRCVYNASATMRSTEGKASLKEAKDMLAIKGKILERIQNVELLPRITFKRTESSFDEETRHKFGYLATLDILPCQLTLCHPLDVVCGTIVFIIEVPYTKLKSELVDVLSCTLSTNGKEKVELTPMWHEDNIEITFEIKDSQNHILVVQLYHQHIRGSPFVVKPKPLEQKVRKVVVNKDSCKTKTQSSGSSSLEDYGQEINKNNKSKQTKGRIVSCAGLNLVAHAIRAAVEDNKRIDKSLQVQREAALGMNEVARKKVVANDVYGAIEPDDNNNTGTQTLCAKQLDSTTGNSADDEGDSDNEIFYTIIPNAEVKSEPTEDLETLPEQELYSPTLQVKIEDYTTEDEAKKPKVYRKGCGVMMPLRKPKIAAALGDISGVYTCMQQEVEIDCELQDEAKLTDDPQAINVLTNDSTTAQGTADAVKLENCQMDDDGNIGISQGVIKDVIETNLIKVENSVEQKIPKIQPLEGNTEIQPDQERPKVQPEEIECKVEGKAPRVFNPNLAGNLIYKSSGPVSDPLQKPIGVAELPDGHIVIADTFNNRLAYFSEDGQFIKYYRTQNLGRPSAIVVLQNGNYAVKDSQSITVFSGDGTSKVITSGLKNPYGLTINKEGNLLTIQATYLGYANVLEIDPESGEILTKVKVEFCHPGEAKRLQSKPRFIAYQGNDQLLIVDLGLNCTFIVNAKTGSIMSVFGESGKGPGQFQDPSGIACDSEGYILIGDSRNHRIQVFSPDGSFVCVLDTDSKLCRPSGICLTPYGFLYILNYWDNSLAKYKIVN